MPDDNNDKLMTQFIEKATPKLLEALSGQITAHVEKQIGGLVENSKTLLDQVKQANAERDALTAKNAADFTQLKTLLERGESPAAIKDALNPAPITLTREQARDTVIYRRARDQAARNGTSVQIVE
jgi:pectin methylesterase-like acyl-CoA thioesterase